VRRPAGAPPLCHLAHDPAPARQHVDGRALACLGAERVLQELRHLAPALADERDHEHVRLRALHRLGHERALAGPGRAEDADALAVGAGQQPVDRAGAERQQPGDERTVERRRRRRFERHGGFGDERGTRLFERAAKAVQHPAEQPHADRDAQAPAAGFDLGQRRQAGHVASGVRNAQPSSRPTTSASTGIARRVPQQAQLADADAADPGFYQRAGNLLDPAARRTGRGAHDGLAEPRHDRQKVRAGQ